MSSRIIGEHLFPHNPVNDYYEKDVEASRSAVYNIESRICAIGALFFGAPICSRILKELDLIHLSPDQLNTLLKFGAAASVAILFGGLFVTRIQLGRLSFGPSLNPSNSLTQSEVRQILTMALTAQEIKNLPIQTHDSLARLISHLETISKDTARMYFSPEQREECKRVIEQIEDIDKHSRTKGEIVGLLKIAKVVLIQRKKVWEKKEKESKEQEIIKSRASFPKLGLFSIKESEIGESATIKLIKYPKNLTQIEHLCCELERSIKGLDKDPDTTLVYIGDVANSLIETEHLKPILAQPEVQVPLRRIERQRAPSMQGGLRSSPTIEYNLDSLNNGSSQ